LIIKSLLKTTEPDRLWREGVATTRADQLTTSVEALNGGICDCLLVAID